MNFSKEKLLEIGQKKRNKEINLSWNDINTQYADNFFSSGEDVRMWIKNQIKSHKSLKQNETGEEKLNFSESVEINKDGSQTSNKLVKMSLEDSKNPEFLLRAHGYDPNSWELISARSNIWNAYSKIDGIVQLYSSRISVRPLKSVFSIERLIESFKNIKPYIIDFNKSEIAEKRMLEIPLFDQHWGVSDFEYYTPTLHRIHSRLSERVWEEIVFVIGQDALHNDNFKGQTSSGTQIEKVDMEKAWEECTRFYEILIRKASQQSRRVKIIYSKGNHDEALSWAFVKQLRAMFPNVEFDDSMIERKIHVFGDNFIGITHGDKARKNLHNIFPIEFPHEWANAKNREIHIGHLHVEDAKDNFGMVVRTLATRNKTDAWHKDNGFVGAHKRFMLFEYSEEELESVHYV